MELKGITARFTLGKNERLKSRKLIAQVFSEGKSVTAHPIKALYTFSDSPFPLQAGFTVSSKSFKRAVDRNRIKRLMREAYRLQKNVLLEKVDEKSKTLIVFFIYTGKEIPELSLVSEKMRSILNTLVTSFEGR